MGIYSIEGVIPVVHPTAFVHPEAVLIGDVHIAAGAYIGPLASLRGDFGRISVGTGANVQDSCVLHSFPGSTCTVEDEGHIGHAAILHGCTIRSGAMVGMNAVIMDNADIGSRALVAANSFVAAETVIPPDHLAAGNPAQVVRQLDEATLAWKANGIKVYQDLTRRSRTTLRQVQPLEAIEPNRPTLSTTSATSIPLREFRRQRQIG
ncbi:phenylacetic acid degradation protein PaaY [Nocardia sp. SYP-A9097]|uniref:acyltransferase n=1 Tax=Nocardia sp. SYP-A9097 TaxID=2663237 RepID=UPI00129A3074|nr:transferase hexapeptide repeat family protein [Nocardia sp. SYP-A9097]MRH87643.1 phenylacetic acid degradation protein PaaY [Nocardia sp. SYP-A9097]